MTFLKSNMCSTKGCRRGGKLTRGMCAKCYRYWLDHTPREERPAAPRFSRKFWDFVHKDGPVPAHASNLGPCWVWTGPGDRKGYGRWGKVLAHRHSWTEANGPILDDLWVLHRCDNPPCVNPDHLYLGTVVENVRDAVERGTVSHPRKERCTEGHLKEGDNLIVVSSGGAKSYRCRRCENEKSARRQREARQARGLLKTRLSEAEKDAILSLRRDGLSQRKIAKEVGRSVVAVQTVLKEAAA